MSTPANYPKRYLRKPKSDPVVVDIHENRDTSIDAQIAAEARSQASAIEAVLAPRPLKPAAVRLDDPSLPPRRPRQWLYGRDYARGMVGALVAQTKTGKSLVLLAEAVSMASGLPILGVPVPAPLRVLLLALEDDLDEVRLRVEAICRAHGVPISVLANLHVRAVDQGLAPIHAHKDGAVVQSDSYTELAHYVRTNGIDVVTVDTFAAQFHGNENDNGAVTASVDMWRRFAIEHRLGVCLCHHIGKMARGEAVTSHGARGASAFAATVRSSRTLTRVLPVDLARLGIAANERILTLTRDIANYASGEARHLKIDTVPVGDEWVAVVVPFEMPESALKIDPGQRDLTVARLAAAEAEGKLLRKDAKSPDWAGHVVADVLGVSTDDEAAKSQIRGYLRDLQAVGMLQQVSRVSGRDRKKRPCLTVVTQTVEAGSGTHTEPGDDEDDA